MKRNLVPAFALALLLAAVPVQAGDLSLFGSWADTDALGDSYGAGAKLDFTFGGTFGLEFRGTYYPDLGEDFGELIDDGIIYEGATGPAARRHQGGAASAEGGRPAPSRAPAGPGWARR